ncbi:hypothetical protein HDV03_005555 [Kappamyces sp. JEL0829]|nr:hypothetical protein HDV03_005555 [Kappamyces sp. JEL0829]
MCYTLASGGFDPKKHDGILQCAEQELLEEARLRVAVVGTAPDQFQAGVSTLVPLVPVNGNPGIPELKWSRNRFIPFVALDGTHDPDGGERDAEELIEIHDLSLEAWNQLILEGKVMPTAVQTTLMAVDWLKRNQLLSL